MRYNKSRQRKVSLIDFIIDAMTDVVPEEVSITDMQAVADKIADEVREHIQAALEDIDLDEVVA